MEAARRGLGRALLLTLRMTFLGLSFLMGKTDAILPPSALPGGANEVTVVEHCAQVKPQKLEEPGGPTQLEPAGSVAACPGWHGSGGWGGPAALLRAGAAGAPAVGLQLVTARGEQAVMLRRDLFNLPAHGLNEKFHNSIYIF